MRGEVPRLTRANLVDLLFFTIWGFAAGAVLGGVLILIGHSLAGVLLVPGGGLLGLCVDWHRADFVDRTFSPLEPISRAQIIKVVSCIALGAAAGWVAGWAIGHSQPVIAAFGAVAGGGLVGAISPIGPLAASLEAHSAMMRSGEVTGRLPSVVMFGVFLLLVVCFEVIHVAGISASGFGSDWHKTIDIHVHFPLLGAFAVMVVCFARAALRVGRERG